MGTRPWFGRATPALAMKTMDMKWWWWEWESLCMAWLSHEILSTPPFPFPSIPRVLLNIPSINYIKSLEILRPGTWHTRLHGLSAKMKGNEGWGEEEWIPFFLFYQQNLARNRDSSRTGWWWLKTWMPIVFLWVHLRLLCLVWGQIICFWGTGDGLLMVDVRHHHERHAQTEEDDPDGKILRRNLLHTPFPSSFLQSPLLNVKIFKEIPSQKISKPSILDERDYHYSFKIVSNTLTLVPIVDWFKLGPYIFKHEKNQQIKMATTPYLLPVDSHGSRPLTPNSHYLDRPTTPITPSSRVHEIYVTKPSPVKYMCRHDADNLKIIKVSQLGAPPTSHPSTRH